MSYEQRLLDQLKRLTQDNQPVAEYIIQFDEFLVRSGENEYGTVLLSRFRSGLRKDFMRELFLGDLSTLEEAYQLIQNLDYFQGFPSSRHTDYKNNTIKVTTAKSQPSQSQYQSHLNLVTLLKNMMLKTKFYSESFRLVQ